MGHSTFMAEAETRKALASAVRELKRSATHRTPVQLTTAEAAALLTALKVCAEETTSIAGLAVAEIVLP